LDPITITLDGLEVSGKPGTTIMELANEIGIEIPSLCYDPHLSPLGACRVCLVEDETSGKLLASCVTPISTGMVINTKSDRVIRNRRGIVELMLASHPDSCIVCDKGNRCKLRKIATDLGIGLIRLEKIPTYHEMVELNPFIQRDMSKCIRCGRCIRADQEIAVVGAIDYTDRGFESRPATLHDRPLEKTECNFCGICVSVCPTGALSEVMRPSTLSADRATRTTCTLCGTGCQILLEHRSGIVLGAAPAQDEQSVNHVSLCVKGHYGMDFINSADRLTTPLIRRDGELVEAAWEEALDLVASRFREIRDAGGPGALGAIGASRSTNEANYLLQKLVRTAFGCNNIDSGARLRGSALDAGLQRVLGSGAMTNTLADLRDAAEILVVGADPLVDSPIAGQLIKQAVRFKGAHLTLVDPLSRGLGAFTGSWIRPRPGTCALFLASLLHEIMSMDSPHSNNGDETVQWFDRLRYSLKPYSAHDLEDATGIPQKLLRRTARRLAKAKSLAIVPGSSLAGSEEAYICGALLAALALYTGNLGRPACGIFPLSQSLNDMGAMDMGARPESLPGDNQYADEQARASFGKAWGAELKPEDGLDYLDMIRAAGSGPLAGLYIVGEDPVGTCPDPEAVKGALAGLDFLVVQDCFMTETAGLAHVVLPASTFAETDGTWTSIERRVQRLRKAIDPKGESRPDWRIAADIMQRMGIQADYASPDEVLNEINGLVPAYSGITPAHLDRESVFRPCTDADDPGRQILYSNAQPAGPQGFELVLPDRVPRGHGEQYPFWLFCNKSLFHSSDGVLTGHSKTITKGDGGVRLEMNPMDADSLGLADKGAVVLHSAAGSQEAEVTLSDDAPRWTLIATAAQRMNTACLFALERGDQPACAPGMHRVAVRVEAKT